MTYAILNPGTDEIGLYIYRVYLIYMLLCSVHTDWEKKISSNFQVTFLLNIMKLISQLKQ